MDHDLDATAYVGAKILASLAHNTKDAVDYAVKCSQEITSATCESPLGTNHTTAQGDLNATSRSSCLLLPTVVQPKPPLEGYVGADAEFIEAAFSKRGFAGIRSLPDALAPGFRSWVVEEKITMRRAATAPPPALPPWNTTRDFRPYSSPGVGQLPLTPYTPHSAKVFGVFKHLHSEYDRPRMCNSQLAAQSKAAWVTEEDFVVKAVVAGPPGIPSFEPDIYREPDNGLPPVHRQNNTRHKTKASAAHLKSAYGRLRDSQKLAFKAGHINYMETLKGRIQEGLRTLSRQLARDWPESFLQMFEDSSGCVAACFDRDRTAHEGDVTSYMNQLARANFIITTFNLSKDSNQWGIVDEHSSSVFYIFWPPWAHHRPFVPPELCGPVPMHSRPVCEEFPAYPTLGRNPYGISITAGGIQASNTRGYQQSMRY